MPTSSRSKSGIFPIAQSECSGLGENIKALVAMVVIDIEALQLTTFKSYVPKTLLESFYFGLEQNGNWSA